MRERVFEEESSPLVLGLVEPPRAAASFESNALPIPDQTDDVVCARTRVHLCVRVCV